MPYKAFSKAKGDIMKTNNINNCLFIKGYIDSDMYDKLYNGIHRFLKLGLKTDNLYLYIESYGGIVRDGLMIIELLQLNYKHIKLYVQHAASMAAPIAVLGKVEYIKHLMVHTVGNYKDIVLGSGRTKSIRIPGKHKKHAKTKKERLNYLAAKYIFKDLIKSMSKEEKGRFEQGKDVYPKYYQDNKRFSDQKLIKSHKLLELGEQHG